MFIFIWILASIGVAYAAQLSLRHPFWWFMVSAILSPLVGSILLWAMNRWNIRPKRVT
jgi:membrane protein YqaA with SNARE-associated domain